MPHERIAWDGWIGAIALPGWILMRVGAEWIYTRRLREGRGAGLARRR